MATPPTPTWQLWPDPTDGPWVVNIWWRVQHGKAVPVGLEMRSWFTAAERSTWDKAGVKGLPEGGAEVELPYLDSAFIKALPFGQIQERARENVQSMFAGDTAEELADFPIGPVLESFRSGEPSRGLGDPHYQEVAAIYRSAVNQGKPPTKAVAEHFVISKSAAAKQVARARSRGFLPETSRGRVGRLKDGI